MNNTHKIACLAAAIVLPAAALTGGIAQAQPHHAPPAAQTVPAQGGSSGQGGGSGQGGPGSGGSGERTGGRDTDNIQLQQGDQTSADGAASQTAREERTGGADTDNVQQGDQTGSDGAASQAVTGEQAGSESGGPSDGPGGHEDVGNVDHQFDGEE